MDILNSSQHDECVNLSFVSLLNTKNLWTRRTTTFVWFLFLMCGATKVSEIFLSSIEQILKRKYQPKANSNQLNVFYDLTIRTIGYNYFEILYPLIHVLENGLASIDSGHVTLILGSSIFDLLTITLVGMLSFSKSQKLRIENIKLFNTWSLSGLLSLFWLFSILFVFSPLKIEFWEAILTLLFFIFYLILSEIIQKCLTPYKEFVLKKTSSNTLLSDQLHYDLENLNFSYESAEKIIKAINKLNANANLFTEAQKLKMIAHYSNLLKNHPFTFYKIKAIQMLTGSSVGSFAIKNELKIYLKENNELFGINDNEHGLDLAKNCFSSECQTDSSVIVEFSACVMAVNPAENYFLVTITRSRNIEIQVYFMLRTSNGSLHSFKHYKPLNNLIFKFEASEFEKKIPIYWIPNSNYKNGDQFYLHLDIHQESSKIARLGPVPNCIISTITNESSSAEIEFLDVMYLLDSFNESLVVKLVRNFRTSGSIAIGFRIFINDIEIDFLNFAFFEVQFLNGEKEKLVKIGGKSLPEIASGKFSLKIFIKKSDFDCRIGQRNEAIIFVQINKDRERKLNKILDAIKAENSIDAKKLSLMDQFVQALSVNNGDLNNSNFNDYFLHLIFLPWKILFSFVPPVDILNGWLTLLISTLISSILIRSIVHESILFGCLIGVDSTTTFFILIPLVLGIPAKDYENSYLIMLARISVSVLFGLGFPWSLVAVFSKIKGTDIQMASNNLQVQIFLFVFIYLICYGFLCLRRNLKLFGNCEFGGYDYARFFSALFLILLLFFVICFILLVSLGVFIINIY